MTTIGVLGLQGAVSEHVRSIVSSGAKAVVVKKVEELDALDGLILPGGESTTMRKLIDHFILPGEHLRKLWTNMGLWNR